LTPLSPQTKPKPTSQLKTILVKITMPDLLIQPILDQQGQALVEGYLRTKSYKFLKETEGIHGLSSDLLKAAKTATEMMHLIIHENVLA